MKAYRNILMAGMLAAACASKNSPPAASSADVAETPSSATNDSASAPLPNDSQTAANASTTDSTSNAATERDSTASNSGTSGSSATNTSTQDDASTAPDNTRVNSRDKKDKTLTPTDQGSSEDDRKITQQIRQAVVKNGSLSFAAKNVKIITNDGKVTLRGPVKTDAERTAIESTAKNIAGVTQVDNQLEVKK